MVLDSENPLAVITNEVSKSHILDRLSAIPEEEIWLADQRSEHTKRAYRQDVANFLTTLQITSRTELRKIDRAAVIAWQNSMKGAGVKASTIRRRLSALSSLFNHLVSVKAADLNPVRDIKRPRINRKRGTTPSLSQKEARAVLDAPNNKSIIGLRDRAILSVGFQVGLRRSEIVSLKVNSHHINAGFHSLRYKLKGGTENSLAINPQTSQRINEYILAAGHIDDFEGPLFRPVRGNRKDLEPRRYLDPVAVDRILRKYAKKALGIERGYSAHSMRATFITTALNNGASLEDVQEAVGHADPSTTKLYDRRGYNPEKAASFFANY